MRYYLAYGSNLNVEQMQYRCPDAVAVDTAAINGHRLAFKGSQTGSYLTIDKCKGHKVPVAVWVVSDKDEKALDRYEGFPTFYYKKDFMVRFDSDGRRHKCFAYVMRDDALFGIPTSFYYKTCLQGYRRFEFDESYLEDALIYSERGCA